MQDVRPEPSGTAAARTAGFTLLELLVVMALMALIVGLVVSRLPLGPSRTQVVASAKSLASGLRTARGAAIHENREAVFTLDVAARRFWVDGRDPVAVMPDIGLAFDIAAPEQASETVGRIRFFPDGSSTGGSIRLKLPDKDAPPTTVTVDGITGHVAVVQ
jgi:general secretion pathway protein H